MGDANPGLEAYVDDMLRVCRKHEYTPTVFIEMRRQLGTVRAISRLVQAGEIQAGLRRMVDLDLVDWTVEAAVLKFPGDFTRDDIACAQFRLAQAKSGT